MSRNPFGQIHHYFPVRLGHVIFHLRDGFQKSAHIKKPNSLLLATPNAQLLPRARSQTIPMSPYEMLLKNISPCALHTKAKLLLECSVELWESR